MLSSLLPTPQTVPAALTPELQFLEAIWSLWQTLAAQGEARLRAEHGLSLRSFMALSYVQAQTRQPSDLARELGVPRYEISRVLSALERDGYVKRLSGSDSGSTETNHGEFGSSDSGSGDARTVTVSITPAGRACWQQAVQTVQDVARPPVHTLTPAQQRRVIADLRRVAQAAQGGTP